MKLYWSPTSPYARKVVVFAHEAGLAGRLELVNGATTPLARNPETAAYNPLGKIPCLVPPDGPSIYDSRVICEYLDTLHDGPKLFPAPGPARWRALTLQALADGMLDAGVLAFYEERFRSPEQRLASWVEGQETKIRAGLDQLEERWISGMGGPLDIGQIAVGCALAWLEFRLGRLQPLEGRPRLKAWFEKLSARDSFKATVPVA